jgi:hypothetical protein
LPRVCTTTRRAAAAPRLGFSWHQARQEADHGPNTKGPSTHGAETAIIGPRQSAARQLGHAAERTSWVCGSSYLFMTRSLIGGWWKRGGDRKSPLGLIRAASSSLNQLPDRSRICGLQVAVTGRQAVHHRQSSTTVGEDPTMSSTHACGQGDGILVFGYMCRLIFAANGGNPSRSHTSNPESPSRGYSRACFVVMQGSTLPGGKDVF